MPKALAEVDADNAFDVNVYVPEGDEDMDDAANVVEALAQRLANRTRYLRNRTGRLAAHNTWTAQNTFEDPVYINDVFEVTPPTAYTPGIHVRRATSGTYQEVLTARAGADSHDRVHIYSGENGATQGAFFFVVNARLESGGWIRNVAGRSSTALIIRDGDVRVVTKAHDAPQPWSSWQQSTLSGFDSEILAEAFRAARVLATGNTDADRTNGFRYIAPVPRTSPIPLGSCWGNVYYNADGHVCRRALSSGDEGNAVWFPVPVPPYCEIAQVHVQFYQLQQADGDHVPDRFQLYRRQHAGGWSPVGSYATHSAATPGLKSAIFTPPGSPLVVLDGDEYAYRWTIHSGDLTVAYNRIVGLAVAWSDVGPSNRVG